MPQDVKKANAQWLRYVYARDAGHLAYIHKATKCENYVTGSQWLAEDRALLAAAQRPALTINKLLITLSSVVGEQIETRQEITLRPRTGASSETADIMTKVFRFISDQNQLNWIRSDVFADGAVTSRGYYDCRLDFSRNLAGDIAITKLNPRNVLPDPDAHEYDPEKWNDVIVTTWMTPDEIEVLYGKPDADILRKRGQSQWMFGYDSIDVTLDRFGSSYSFQASVPEDLKNVLRSIRVIERQHRVLKKVKFFVDTVTGMKREIPDEWTKENIAEMLSKNDKLAVTEDVVKKIRWTVTADDLVLFDEWSPYRYFTVIPYFPVLRYGRTVGLVEGLLDPQELLNKTISQELHVVNTMANSGWIVRSGALLNMTMDELEEMGAKTGLVLEVGQDVTKDIAKITPNAIPTGLDRISFKAENFIKSISGRGDSVMGLDRADVSGKAIGEKKQSADVPLRPALDNLERTDWMLARQMLDIVQRYYTDPRILNITKDDLTGETTTVSVNMPQPGSGEILNDLSLGTFDIVVTSQSAKRTLEESQFEQALAMRELGIMLPDRFLIQNSNLMGKSDIVKAMDAQSQTPEAQAQKQAQILGTQLEVANLKAEASEKEAKAVATRAKAAKDMAEAEVAGAGVDAEMQLEQAKHEQEMQMMREKHQLEMQIKRDEAQMKLQLQREQMREKARQERLKTVMAAKQAQATPSTVDEAAKLAKAGGGMMQQGANGPGAPGGGADNSAQM